MLTTAPRGTHDILPDQAPVWRHIEGKIQALCRRYGYGELRPPVFEHTELFLRGVGETTDIVEKEMYTFTDRGDRSLSLRPELTAGLVRAYLEHKLYAGPQPVKIYSIGSGFRYERPQAGRYRQFTQWDVEVFGAQDPSIDAEVISMGLDLVGELGLSGLSVRINSIGCPVCRPRYRAALQEHYRPHLAELCGACQSRFERNPLRLIDCKAETCQPHKAGVPRMIDHLCDECRAHFDGLQHHLTALGVPFEVDPGIVRGLDYYTKTVFEVIYPALGAQSTVWGGGRYDGLIETLGGQSTPGVGFAMGLERLILTLEKMGKTPAPESGIDAFVAAFGDDAAARTAALRLVHDLRRAGLAADTDYLGRGIKAQMKHADRLGANYVAIIGPDEAAKGVVTLKNMATGEQMEVTADQAILILKVK